MLLPACGQSGPNSGVVSASEIPKGFEPWRTSLGSVRGEMQALLLRYQTLIKQLNALGSTLVFPNALDWLVLLHIMDVVSFIMATVADSPSAKQPREKSVVVLKTLVTPGLAAGGNWELGSEAVAD